MIGFINHYKTWVANLPHTAEETTEWLGHPDTRASVDETGNVITETQTLTLSVEDYDALETDKDVWSAQTSESDVIECYTQTKTVYPGDKLYVQGEVIDDFHVLRKETIWALSTVAVQQIDRIQQQHDAQIADLQTAVESRDQQIDELRGELSDIVSRLEALDA